MSGLPNSSPQLTRRLACVRTKIRIASEGVKRPAFGFRFATKLPNAGNESGLGLDTTDFFASILMGKTTRQVRIVGNFGLAILANPTEATSQKSACDRSCRLTLNAAEPVM